MRRFLVLVTLLTLVGTACSSSENTGKESAGLNDYNLGTIETAIDESSPGIENGDQLVDAGVGTDGVLYLALRDAKGRHRLLSTRGESEPFVLADEKSVEGFKPTAMAVDSRLRWVYVASGSYVLKFVDSRGTQGVEEQFRELRPEDNIGPPRYLSFDSRTKALYVADLCRVVRFTSDQRAGTEVAAAAGPGVDCLQTTARITGLAVDQRTGDVYVGVGNELRRVGADGKLTAVRAKGRNDTEPQPVVGLGASGALAVNGVGDVLVATETKNVLRVRADGTLDQVTGIKERPTQAHSGPATDVLVLEDGEDWIGFDGAGNLYLATRTLHDGGGPPVRLRKVIAAAL